MEWRIRRGFEEVFGLSLVAEVGEESFGVLNEGWRHVDDR